MVILVFALNVVRCCCESEWQGLPSFLILVHLAFVIELLPSSLCLFARPKPSSRVAHVGLDLVNAMLSTRTSTKTLFLKSYGPN